MLLTVSLLATVENCVGSLTSRELDAAMYMSYGRELEFGTRLAKISMKTKPFASLSCGECR